MKINEFPLEIKLIIYEYYDPKDKLVVVNYNLHYNNYYYFIYIDGEENTSDSFLNNNTHIYFLHSKFIEVDGYTIYHFLWRKSQVACFYEKLIKL